MAQGAPLLELEGVSKRFGPVQALDRVDFDRKEEEKHTAKLALN